MEETIYMGKTIGADAKHILLAAAIIFTTVALIAAAFLADYPLQNSGDFFTFW